MHRSGVAARAQFQKISPVGLPIFPKKSERLKRSRVAAGLPTIRPVMKRGNLEEIHVIHIVNTCSLRSA